MHKALLGYSGGRLLGRSAEEKGREEGEDDEAAQLNLQSCCLATA